MPLSKKTFNKMPFIRMKNSRIAFNRKTRTEVPHKIHIQRMMFTRMTFSIISLSKMTLFRMAFKRMTLDRMTLCGRPLQDAN